MTGRFRPEHGADSAEAWQPTAWRVLLDCYDGGRTEVIVNAIGRHDARGLAFEEAREQGFDPEAMVRAEQVPA